MSDAQDEILMMLKDLLEKSPETANEAIELYNTIIDKIAHHFLAKLPTLEEKTKVVEQMFEMILKRKISLCCM